MGRRRRVGGLDKKGERKDWRRDKKERGEMVRS
jgi:hypothetical protein